MLTSERSVEVFPVPGPPVRIDSFPPSALRTAARCSSWNAKALLLLGPFQGRLDLDGREPARDAEQPGDDLGDLPLRAVVHGQLQEARAGQRLVGRVREMPCELLRRHQRVDPSGDESRGGVQHLGGVVPEGLLAEGGVPLLLEGLHREEDPRLEPRGGVVREAEVDGYPVGGLEADPLDLAGDPVGLGRQDRLRLGAVLLHELHALAGADPVGLQEDVELALGSLAFPRQLDRRRPLAPDARHVAQLRGLLAQHPEGVRPELVDDLVRVHAPDPGDEPAPQVLADAVDARGQLALEGRDLELRPVLGVLGPFPGEVQGLAALDAGKGADDRHRLGLGRPLGPVRPELRDGVVVLLVEKDDPLDDSREGGGCG